MILIFLCNSLEKEKQYNYICRGQVLYDQLL